MEIKGKTAVVTGGASGLGKATVKHLASLGAKVAVFDVSREAGERFVEELNAENVLFCQVDITDSSNVVQAIETAVNSFGSIHQVVNCAGIGVAEKVLSKKGVMPLEHFSRIINVNLIGSFNVVRLAAEKMAKNEPDADGERGVIINTSSIAAFEGQIGQAAYSASKGGIVGMTLPLAREFASLGIRVLAIAPGIFLTPMLQGLSDQVKKSLGASIPFPSRLGKPYEYAMLVEHIIQNAFLNGTTIRLDGAIRLAPQ